MSKGWKKWECPEDFLTVESKLKTLQLTERQQEELSLAYYRTELKNSKSPEEKQSWLDLIAKKKSKLIKESLQEGLVEDFQLWLQGRSKYNVKHIEEVKYNPINNKWEKTKRECTPWGNKTLLHLPDVCQWLKLPVLNRDKVAKGISTLKMTTPTDIESAWIYYKYITRAVGIDGNILKEQRNYNVFDYIEKRPQRVANPDEPGDKEDLNQENVFEDDDRFTPFSIDNPSMPRFNEAAYNQNYRYFKNEFDMGNLHVLLDETDKWAMFTPDDKLVLLLGANVNFLNLAQQNPIPVSNPNAPIPQIVRYDAQVNAEFMENLLSSLNAAVQGTAKNVTTQTNSAMQQMTKQNQAMMEKNMALLEQLAKNAREPLIARAYVVEAEVEKLGHLYDKLREDGIENRKLNFETLRELKTQNKIISELLQSRKVDDDIRAYQHIKMSKPLPPVPISLRPIVEETKAEEVKAIEDPIVPTVQPPPVVTEAAPVIQAVVEEKMEDVNVMPPIVDAPQVEVVEKVAEVVEVPPKLVPQPVEIPFAFPRLDDNFKFTNEEYAKLQQTDPEAANTFKWAMEAWVRDRALVKMASDAKAFNVDIKQMAKEDLTKYIGREIDAIKSKLEETPIARVLAFGVKNEYDLNHGFYLKKYFDFLTAEEEEIRLAKLKGVHAHLLGSQMNDQFQFDLSSYRTKMNDVIKRASVMEAYEVEEEKKAESKRALMDEVFKEGPLHESRHVEEILKLQNDNAKYIRQVPKLLNALEVAHNTKQTVVDIAQKAINEVKILQERIDHPDNGLVNQMKKLETENQEIFAEGSKVNVLYKEKFYEAQQLQNEVRELQQNVAMREEHIKQLESLLAVENSRVNELGQLLANAQTQPDFQRDLARLNQQYANALEEQKILNQQLAQQSKIMESELFKEQQKYKEIEGHLAKLNAEKEQAILLAQNNYQASENLRLNYEGMKGAQERQADEYKKQIEDLKKQMINMQHSDISRAHFQLTEEYKQLASEHERLKQRNENLSERSKAEVALKDIEIKKKEEMFSRTSQILSESRVNAAKLQELIQTKTKEVEFLEAKIKLMDKEKEAHNKTKAEMDALNKKYEAVTKERLDLKMEVRKMKIAGEKADKKLKKMQELEEQLQGKTMNQKAIYQQHRKEIAELEEQVKELEGKLAKETEIGQEYFKVEKQKYEEAVKAYKESQAKVAELSEIIKKDSETVKRAQRLNTWGDFQKRLNVSEVQKSHTAAKVINALEHLAEDRFSNHVEKMAVFGDDVKSEEMDTMNKALVTATTKVAALRQQNKEKVATIEEQKKQIEEYQNLIKAYNEKQNTTVRAYERLLSKNPGYTMSSEGEAKIENFKSSLPFDYAASQEGLSNQVTALALDLQKNNMVTLMGEKLVQAKKLHDTYSKTYMQGVTARVGLQEKQNDVYHALNSVKNMRAQAKNEKEMTMVDDKEAKLQRQRALVDREVTQLNIRLDRMRTDLNFLGEMFEEHPGRIKPMKDTLGMILHETATTESGIAALQTGNDLIKAVDAAIANNSTFLYSLTKEEAHGYIRLFSSVAERLKSAGMIGDPKGKEQMEEMQRRMIVFQDVANMPEEQKKRIVQDKTVRAHEQSKIYGKMKGIEERELPVEKLGDQEMAEGEEFAPSVEEQIKFKAKVYGELTMLDKQRAPDPKVMEDIEKYIDIYGHGSINREIISALNTRVMETLKEAGENPAILTEASTYNDIKYTHQSAAQVDYILRKLWTDHIHNIMTYDTPEYWHKRDKKEVTDPGYITNTPKKEFREFLELKSPQVVNRLLEGYLFSQFKETKYAVKDQTEHDLIEARFALAEKLDTHMKRVNYLAQNVGKHFDVKNHQEVLFKLVTDVERAIGAHGYLDAISLQNETNYLINHGNLENNAQIGASEKGETLNGVEKNTMEYILNQSKDLATRKQIGEYINAFVNQTDHYERTGPQEYKTYFETLRQNLLKTLTENLTEGGHPAYKYIWKQPTPAIKRFVEYTGNYMDTLEALSGVGYGDTPKRRENLGKAMKNIVLSTVYDFKKAIEDVKLLEKRKNIADNAMGYVHIYKEAIEDVSKGKNNAAQKISKFLKYKAIKI